MRGFHKHIASNLLIGVIAFQAINLSINSASFYDSVSSTVSVDDPDYVDSMIEFLVENVLGFSKNTFHDKANGNDIAKMKLNILYHDLKCNYLVDSLHLFEETYTIVQPYPANEDAVLLCYREVIPNPPQTTFA
jgi:hypothetical protein